MNDVSLRSGPSGETRCQRLYKFSGAQLCDEKRMRIECHATRHGTHHPGQRAVLVKERPGERWSVRHVDCGCAISTVGGETSAPLFTTYTLLPPNFSRFPRMPDRPRRVKGHVPSVNSGSSELISASTSLHVVVPVVHTQHAPLTPPHRKVMSILPARRGSHVFRGRSIAC